MRVLITGATGFVGSHLVAALAERGAEIRALVRRTSQVAQLERLGVERIEGGLDDPAALARGVEGADVVFHLAALTSARSAEEYEWTNVHGTSRLLSAIAAAGAPPKRLVYLSSLAAVGPSRDGRPVERGDACRPLTTYGRTKLAGEEACLGARESVETIVLRPPAVYGPRDREILRFFRLAARGLLPVPAGPDRLVQMVHVTDLAEAAINAAMATAAAGVYHVAEPRAYRWDEVAELFGAALGRRVRTVRIPTALITTAAAVSETTARALGRSTVFNREKARELLAPGWLCETDALRHEVGFTPRIGLADGLAQTAAWYRAEGWL
jgi:nucleoside-diphosphate-sugar epimerase